MKVIYTLLFITASYFFTHTVSASQMENSDNASQAILVVPNAYTAANGTGTFLGPLANAQRTYQFLIQASQLTGLLGTELTGLSMRIPASATANWPLSDVTYTNYDIYLSGSVEPAARSLTFANNIVGPQTQVRSGSLTIPANSYTFGGSPNAFGPEITFNTPWLYSGGNVLIELRQSGFTGTSRSTDAIITSTAGYGTLFSACWTGSYTGLTGTQGNFTVVKLNGNPAPPSLLFLTCLIEGLYNGTTNIMISDTATVYLRNSFAPYALVDSAVSVLDSNGDGTFTFQNAADGVNYFIVVDQRNSITTWSSAGFGFISGVLGYDFTDAASTAYGNNQTLVGSKWTIYSGDVNKDGFIDLTDLIAAANDASNFVTGYVPTDVNGDLEVNLLDMLIIYNNSAQFVAEVHP